MNEGLECLKEENKRENCEKKSCGEVVEVCEIL